MDIRQKIHDDMISAMRSKDNARRDTLRLVEGVIRNKIIEFRGQGKEINDEDIMALIATQVKQRRESSRQFLLGNRQDLSKKEEEEITILESYLPQKVGDEDIEHIVTEVIGRLKPKGISDMGRVMGEVMSQAKKMGSIDGKSIREKVTQQLERLSL